MADVSVGVFPSVLALSFLTQETKRDRALFLTAYRYSYGQRS